MARTTRVVFQPYLRGKRGGIAPGPAIACRTPEEAQRRADKALAGGSVIGAHIVQVSADEEAGDYGEPVYLATIGAVPDSG